MAGCALRDKGAIRFSGPALERMTLSDDCESSKQGDGPRARRVRGPEFLPTGTLATIDTHQPRFSGNFSWGTRRLEGSGPCVCETNDTNR